MWRRPLQPRSAGSGNDRGCWLPSRYRQPASGGTVSEATKRSQAVLVQLTAVLLAGAVPALAGQALVIAGVALAGAIVAVEHYDAAHPGEVEPNLHVKTWRVRADLFVRRRHHRARGTEL